MPSLNSFADLLRDWELLLRACEDNPETQSITEPQRAALGETLEQVRVLKARQDSHNAARQEITQELEEIADMGREQARRLRGMAKGFLGTKNARLVQFKIAPVRPRSRRRTAKKPPAAPPPPEGPPSEISS
jgi:hypothetical protein